MARNDPYKNFRFRLEIGQTQVAGFSEVSGFDITVDPIDYRKGTDPGYVRKLSGLTKYGNVTMKWGMTDNMDLYNWHKQIVDGDVVRASIAVVLVDEAGSELRPHRVEAAVTRDAPVPIRP